MAYRRTIAKALVQRSCDGQEEAVSQSNGRSLSKRKKVLEADAPLVVKGRTQRDRIAQWIAYRAAEPGITNIEVAKRLGINAHVLNTMIWRACREGWLKFESPESRIEYEIIPKAIQNLNEMLDDKDKSATLETLKGTAFPIYREAKGAGDGGQTVLALKIETVEPIEIKQVTGNMVGKARELPSVIIEGDVKDEA